MHEKYFLPPSQSGMRSIESTPQARRKQLHLGKLLGIKMVKKGIFYLALVGNI